MTALSDDELSRELEELARMAARYSTEDVSVSPDAVAEGVRKKLTAHRVEQAVADIVMAENMAQASAETAFLDLGSDEFWDLDAPAPEVLTREDGEPAFYLGQRNAVAGKTGGGKTWLCMLAAAQELQAGRPVVMFDWENGPRLIKARLRALGVTREQIRGLWYVDASGRAPLPPALATEKAAALVEAGGRLALFDAMTAIATSLGLEVHGGDTNAVETVFTVAVDPWAKAGLAAVLLDNSPKGDDLDIAGSQHKKAAVGGVALGVVSVRPFSASQAGYAQVHVIKDRAGRVAAVGDFPPLWGTFHVSPDGFGRGVTVRVEAPPAGVSGLALAALKVVQTVGLAAEALRSRGVTECRTMSDLADWMSDVRSARGADFEHAHTDRKYIGQCLATAAEEDLRDAGLTVEVAGAGKRRRYTVSLR